MPISPPFLILVTIFVWSSLSCVRADSPPFTPLPAVQLEVKSIAKHEVRDSEEAKAGGPKIKVARSNQVFQFKRADGTRVTVMDGKKSEANRNNSKIAASLWSFDDGKSWTWREGPSDDAANSGPGSVEKKRPSNYATMEKSFPSLPPLSR